MTTNNKKLVDLLSEKTGLSKDEVDKHLRQFVETIRERVQKDGSCRLEQFGTFKLKDGELHFETDKNLALEINHKYAGMKPIELVGAYKDLSGEAMPLTATGNNGDLKPAADEISSPEDDVEKEPVVFEQKQETEEEKELQEDMAPTESEESLQEEPGPVPEMETVAEDKADETPAPKAVPEKEEVDAVPETKKIAAGEKWQSGSKYRQRKRPENPVGKWLIAAVVVIAVGISAWLIYGTALSDGGSEEALNNESNGQAVQSMDRNPNAGEGDGEQASVAGTGADMSGPGQENTSGRDSEENGNKMEQDTADSTSSVADIAEQSRQSVYGLRGGATPDVSDGYTIVVHSLRDEAKVRRLNSELQQEGYRTTVFSAEVMDTTFWRLGLGQFKTIADALEAAKTLPKPYRENHFIKRIQ